MDVSFFSFLAALNAPKPSSFKFSAELRFDLSQGRAGLVSLAPTPCRSRDPATDEKVSGLISFSY
jgi:hypothetical protein